MPFASKAQRAYLFAEKPALAREFAAHTPKGAKLPEHARKRKARKAALDAMVRRFEDGSGETAQGRKAKPLYGSASDDNPFHFRRKGASR